MEVLLLVVMEAGQGDDFESASKFMRATAVKLDNDKKLKLYGLYKQVQQQTENYYNYM